MDNIPIISKELIEYLEEICPDQSPALNVVDRRIWFDAGKVDLVHHLQALHTRQNETILQGT